MNNFIDKYNCVLCKYNKYNKNDGSCWDYKEKDEYGYPIGKCKSLSNIYYGTIIEFFPFKHIHNLATKITWRKEEKYNNKMDKKYNNYTLENDDMKFIWGVKSWDDLSGTDACFYTMNDIDIIYDKKEKEYYLEVETAYSFDNGYKGECKYLQQCLDAFTKYMDDNNLDKNKNFSLFMFSPNTEISAKTIEELYTNFKIFVNGYCNYKKGE